MAPRPRCKIDAAALQCPAIGFNKGIGGRMQERLTALLSRMQDGDRGARDALFVQAYDGLRRLAHSRLHEGGRNTVLDTTALVHESYLRLVQIGELKLQDRRAFFAYASQVMRSVIVDSARARLAERRGGDAPKLTLVTDLLEGEGQGEEAIIRVHEALLELDKADARAARMVEMRFFGGYSDREIAETMDVTERTVQRDWEKAKLLLRAMLAPD
jgi:RNA polymerase sigma factor (TIGR02999 family)